MRFLLRTIALAAVLVACDIVSPPDPICACSPTAPGITVIYGEVRDPADNLIESSRITAHLVGDAPCPAAPAALQPGLFNTTGGSGQFRYALGWASPVTKCWALWAAPPNGTSLAASDTVLVVANYTASASDSVFVRLHLR